MLKNFALQIQKIIYRIIGYEQRNAKKRKRTYIPARERLKNKRKKP